MELIRIKILNIHVIKKDYIIFYVDSIIYESLSHRIGV